MLVGVRSFGRPAVPCSSRSNDRKGKQSAAALGAFFGVELKTPTRQPAEVTFHIVREVLLGPVVARAAGGVASSQTVKALAASDRLVRAEIVSGVV